MIAVVGLHPGSADGRGRGGARAAPVDAPTGRDARSRRARTVWPGPSRTTTGCSWSRKAPHDPAQRSWHDFCLRQADAVVLVSHSDAPVPEEPVTRLLCANPTSCSSGRRRHPPTSRRGWPVTDAWQLTVVEGDLGLGVRALADRLAGRSLGLVLAGGGARAFAHVGVLRELEDARASTSTGWPAAASARSSRPCTPSVTTAKGSRTSCYAEFVRRTPFTDWGLPTASLARGRRVHEAAARTFGDAVLRGSAASAATSSAPTWSAAPARCIGAARSSTRSSPRCGCRCCSRRCPTTRAAADRRRCARQPAGRPPHRARRGTGRGRQHLDGWRWRRRPGLADRTPPSARLWGRPCCAR